MKTEWIKLNLEGLGPWMEGESLNLRIPAMDLCLEEPPLAPSLVKGLEKMGLDERDIDGLYAELIDGADRLVLSRLLADRLKR